MAEKVTGETTVIKSCGCRHEWQDKKYGSGQRVHNALAADKGWRCTVCGKVHG